MVRYNRGQILQQTNTTITLSTFKRTRNILTLGSRPLAGRIVFPFELRFFSTWYCLRLFCTANRREMNVFFSSFSYSSSSRSASSVMSVSENSRMSTSSSMYSSFSWPRLRSRSSEKVQRCCI